VAKGKLPGHSLSQILEYQRAAKKAGMNHINIVAGGADLMGQYRRITQYFAEGQYLLMMTDNVTKIVLKRSVLNTAIDNAEPGLLMALTAHAWHVMATRASQCWSLQANKNPLNMQAGRVSYKFGLLDGNCYGLRNSRDESLAIKVSNVSTDLEFSCRSWRRWRSFHRYLGVSAVKRYRAPGGLQRYSQKERWAMTCQAVRKLAKEFPELVSFVPSKNVSYAGQPYRVHQVGEKGFDLACLIQNKGRPRKYHSHRASSVKERVAAWRRRRHPTK
jgi:hypothetical protein